MIYLIYGRPKVGKTTLALKDAPKGKTAVISADQGLIGVDTSGITVIEDTGATSLNKTVMNSRFTDKYDRIVIDTATSLYHDFLMEISGGKPPSLNQRGQANTGFAALIRSLRNSKKEVIILAQEKMVLPTEDWISEDDDEDITASVTADLPAGPHNILVTLADVIGRLYIAQQGGRSARRLWLATTPNIVAGARTRKYRGNPPYLKNPSITRLNDLLGWTV